MSILITVVNTMSITKVIEKIEKESEIVSSECLRLREGESTYEREKNDPQMAITFHSEVRFICIIYRDARNSTMEALEQFKWS